MSETSTSKTMRSKPSGSAGASKWQKIGKIWKRYELGWMILGLTLGWLGVAIATIAEELAKAHRASEKK
jgi:hypothetical protein